MIRHHHKFRNRDIIIDLRDFFDAMQIFRFPTIPSDHQPRRQNTNLGFSCKRSRNTFHHCNRAMWLAAISFVGTNNVLRNKIMKIQIVNGHYLIIAIRL